MAKKTVVTGGAGFIGSHLTERLLKDGHHVTVLDNYSSGSPENLSHLQDNPNFKMIETDVADTSKIMPYFRDADWIFHLAALADIVPSIEKPMQYYHSNVTGTASVLEASRWGGVKRFLYTASSSCYGIADLYPTPESAPVKPEYPYALTKFLGEELAMHWGKVYDIPVISLRLFNVYGPRSRTSGTYGAVFGIFLAQKLHGKPFTVVGDGTQKRDFTYVTDVVNAFIMAAKSDVRNEIFNVASSAPVSVNRLTELLGGKKEFIPKRPGEPDVTHADTSKIRKILGWEPAVPIEEGVENLLARIRDYREAPVWTPDSIQKATESWFRYLGKKS